MSEWDGLGSDEFEGSATHRGFDGSPCWAADGRVRGSGVGVERSADAPIVGALRRWRWRCPDSSGTRPDVE